METTASACERKDRGGIRRRLVDVEEKGEMEGGGESLEVTSDNDTEKPVATEGEWGGREGEA